MRRYPFEMFEEMERMFDGMRRSMDAPSWSGQHRSDRSAIRLEQADGGYHALADLPGFEKEDIDIRFDDGVLSVTADHEVTDDSAVRSRHVSESIQVPGEVIVDDITATYRNGVLEITLPTADDEEETHRIDIE